MIQGFTRWGYRLRALGPVFVLGILGALIALALVIFNDWDEGLYPSVIGLMWSLLGLCFIWWFQPAGPNAVLLTTAWGRFKAKISKFFAVLKCWLFLAMLVGVIGLTVRFVLMWQDGVPLL